MISAPRHESRRGSVGSSKCRDDDSVFIHPFIHRQINSIPIGISKPRILRKLFGTSTVEVLDLRRLSDHFEKCQCLILLGNQSSGNVAMPEQIRSRTLGLGSGDMMHWLRQPTSLNEARLKSQNYPHV